MRILVDCCNYFLDNHNNGDMAIYRVFVKRMMHFWPHAEIDWITLDPDLIRRSIPEVKPLLLQKRHEWQLFNTTRNPIMRALEPARSGWTGYSWLDQYDSDRAEKTLAKRRLELINQAPDIDVFLRKFQNVDMVVALGGGSFSDHFAEHARGLLDTLAGGLAFGKTTALMCAGFETISNKSLITKSKSVIPHLQLIACREPDAGPRILSSFGVPDHQIRVTGDDAIELAYDLRPDRTGDALGINVRQSAYSGIDDRMIESIRSAVQDAGRKYNVPLLSLPISVFGPSDIDSVKKIISGYDGTVDVGEKLNTPEDVIRQTGRCRIVITGSYHSAVFALAQGIPVLALACSHHYLTKFTGLAMQFQVGCTIINPQESGFEKELINSIEETWRNSMNFKHTLLDSAREQIGKSWKAYQDLYELVKQ